MNVRARAARLISSVVDGGKSLSALLDESSAGAEQALLQELCYGVIRYWYRLDALAGQLLQRPLKRKDGDVRALILVGLYQLLYMRIPAHAAVTETVAATAGLRKAWSKGLVNALLRSFQRDSERLLTSIEQDPQASSLSPAWLLKLIQDGWPQHWRNIIAASNARAPMSLRVNLARNSRETYRQHLQAAGLEAHALALTEAGLQLASPCDVHTLPGFDAGDVSVQDGAAQLAAPLLDAQTGERVLDACAAPGGKTAHILERLQAGQMTAEVIALDVETTRLARVDATLQRLQLAAKTISGDAAHPADWWDGQPFDRILLDAPCSATGVIRRHPDIRLLRRADDIPRLVETQQQILASLWPLLRPGGRLLYATCSILPQENAENIARFTRAHDDARLQPITADWGHDTGHGRQILPGEQDMDGFFYACLEKQRQA
jgi:16S rRNA (cytosine967-C5)-methyltransferase